MSSEASRDYSVEILAVRVADAPYVMERVKARIGSAESLLEDPRFRNVSLDPGLRDHVGVFSIKEIMDLVRLQMETELDAAGFEVADRTGEEGEIEPDTSGMHKASRHIERVRRALRPASFVIVHIYDW